MARAQEGGGKADEEGADADQAAATATALVAAGNSETSARSRLRCSTQSTLSLSVSCATAELSADKTSVRFNSKEGEERRGCSHSAREGRRCWGRVEWAGV